MVPRIHKKGKSFRGAAAYVLHDKDKASTSERVGFTATRNLATDDPETAWRVMAATAMDQNRLKAEAGIPNTGRKSTDHVLHFTLSWHESEAEDLTHEEMMRATNQALHALDAGDRQALIAAHTDTAEPHVHILVNRVSMDDGRMLSSSKEKLKLSAWAEAYERERGQILCQERVINNDRRRNKQYTRDTSHRSYHILDVEVANDNKPGFDQAQADQIAKDAALAAERSDRVRRQREAWEAMEARHSGVLEELAAREQRLVWEAERTTAAEHRPRFQELLRRHEEERATWQANENRVLGRVKNALRATDWRAMLRREDRPAKLREAYDAFASSGARLQALNSKHDQQREALRREEIATQHQRANIIKQQIEDARLEQNALFEAERHSAILSADMEAAAERASWVKRNEERRRAYESLGHRGRRNPSPDRDVCPGSRTTEDEIQQRPGAGRQRPRAIRRGKHRNDRDYERGR